MLVWTGVILVWVLRGARTFCWTTVSTGAGPAGTGAGGMAAALLTSPIAGAIKSASSRFLFGAHQAKTMKEYAIIATWSKK